MFIIYITCYVITLFSDPHCFQKDFLHGKESFLAMAGQEVDSIDSYDPETETM